MVALIVFLVVALPALGFLLWLLLESSFVRIESGQLGLVMVRGKATDRALLPGRHFVPSIRRMMVEVYPSNELALRLGEPSAAEPTPGELERSGPALVVTLGDRTLVELGCTIRFRVRADQLRPVHERFGPDGLWAAVRDQTSLVVRERLGQPEVGVERLFGPPRRALEEELGSALGESLAAEGFEVALFAFGDLDLGPTGDVIQAIVRARLELEREQAESATRVARARSDAELEPYLAQDTTEAALRYREVDLWRELLRSRDRRLPVPAPPRGPAPAPAAAPAQSPGPGPALGAAAPGEAERAPMEEAPR